MMHSCPSPLKDRQGSATSSWDNDVVSSKLTPVGRDATEAPQDTDTVVSQSSHVRLCTKCTLFDYLQKMWDPVCRRN